MANVTPLSAGTMTAFVIGSGAFLNAGTIVNDGTIAQAQIPAQGLIGNAATTAAAGGGVSLAPGLTLLAGSTAYPGGTLAIVAGGTTGIGTVGTIVGGAGILVNGTAGGTLTNAGTLSIGELVNTTTVGGYTLAVGDQAKLVHLTYAGVTEPILSTGSYAVGYRVSLMPNFTYGGYITASSGTINNGGSVFYYSPAQRVDITFDGTNYLADASSPFVANSQGALLFGSGGMGIGSSNTLTSVYPNLAVGTGNSLIGTSAVGIGSSNSVGSGGLAVGSSNTVGPNAAAVGSHGTVAFFGLAVGVSPSDNGTQGAFTQGSQVNCQVMRLVMSNNGSPGTSPMRLVSAQGNSFTPSVSNVGSLAAKQSASFRLTCEVHDDTNGGSVGFVYGNGGVNLGKIAQTGSTAATTTIVAGGTFAQGPQIGSIAALGSFSVAADTTLGGFNIDYTPGAGNTAALSATAELELIFAG
nr:hypothetical protein [uncultured Rhodopila sp.]